MMKYAAAFFILALLCAAAEAQHDHAGKPAAAVVQVDPKRGKVLAAPAPGETMEHAMDHAVPVGKGAVDAETLGAWLTPPTTGEYLFPQTSVVKGGARVPVILGASGERVNLIAGRPYRVRPWKGPLVWTPPGGQQGVVPPEFLIAINPANVVKR